jgi:hypothetical protein
MFEQINHRTEKICKNCIHWNNYYISINSDTGEGVIGNCDREPDKYTPPSFVRFDNYCYYWKEK